MPCYHQIPAYQTESGEIVFAERGAIRRSLLLPCGRCIGCRLSRSRNWAVRIMHESQMHDASSFVTLTYSDEHLKGPSLVYRDFQLFMKRLRRSRGPTRFFAVGEYGADAGKRPHFHSLLFGCYFQDGESVGGDLYRSGELERLWPFGMSSFGSVTFQSAAYVARYCVDKVNGPLAEEHYKRVHLQTGEIVDVVPEMAHMSLRPAIGRSWFEKYWREVYEPRDGVVMEGKVVPPPRRYDKWLEDTCPELRYQRDFDRYVKSAQFVNDCSPERLAVREAVEIARISTLKRKL